MTNTKGKWATPDTDKGKIAADIRTAVRNAMEREPYDHSSVEAIRKRIMAYFEECATEGKPPRIEGLTNALDVSRMTLLNWQKEGGRRGELIRQSKGVISDLLEAWSMEGQIPSIHWMFMAKTAFGYIENNRTVHAVEVINGKDGTRELTKEEIIRRLPDAEFSNYDNEDIAGLLEVENTSVPRKTLHDKKDE